MSRARDGWAGVREEAKHLQAFAESASAVLVKGRPVDEGSSPEQHFQISMGCP